MVYRECSEGGLARETHPVADIRARPPPTCMVCEKMNNLSGQGSGGFDLTGLPTPPTTASLTAAINGSRFNPNNFPEFSSYLTFISHPKVRMRYYVQAHLHWFGFFPELIGSGSTSTPIPANRMGFPRFHVDGRWGNNSKNAYHAFLTDTGEATGWTRDNDIIQAADITLILQKCAEGYCRTGFRYTDQYTIRNRDGSDFVRPFTITRANLSPPAADDLLTELIERDATCVPRRDLAFHGSTLNNDFAPFSSLPSTLQWPVHTTSQHRWGLHYSGVDSSSGRDCNRGSSGRKFDGERESGTRVHGGIDLLDDAGDPIVAIADGQIVGFDGANAPTATCFLFIYHPGLGSGITVNYGEVHHESLIRTGLMVGDSVTAGQVIGASGRMQQDTMLHFETYAGYQNHWYPWRSPFTTSHGGRLNPTKLLCAIRQNIHDQRPAS